MRTPITKTTLLDIVPTYVPAGVTRLQQVRGILPVSCESLLGHLFKNLNFVIHHAAQNSCTDNFQERVLQCNSG